MLGLLSFPLFHTDVTHVVDQEDHPPCAFAGILSATNPFESIRDDRAAEPPVRRRAKALVVFGSLVGTLRPARAITDEDLSAEVLEQGVPAALKLVETP